ncbi:alpha/beta hydrolase [Actinomadura sp. DC4]|uniref:alpha/beta fold hydrolase n=1 Tax=Actinomadura sp. DC4 TaxID=3055069 RepID=UPI0025B1306C|nr:alpha/beta hydrolase [Actinomadura sp. DC4]MDN3358988.1 alpha/beta hydrolase [Actinomadura sp. DC4]
MRSLPSVLCAALLAAGATFAAAPAHAESRPGTHCAAHTLDVRLADDGPRAYRMWGELCHRGRTAPATVQLLIPGGGYNSTYWDFPYRKRVYSYVRAATAAGYATFDVDRVGSGRSTHPPYTDMTIAGEATSMHDVVTALRSGAVGGHAFRHVIEAGHSFGSAVGVTEAARYHDVDGFISLGGVHAVSDAAQDIFDSLHDANLDPKFAGLGYDGYQTTVPGTRGHLYHDTRTSTPAMIALDERLKDVSSSTGGPEIVAYSLPATPGDAISRRLTMPALVLVGGSDLIFCGAGAIDCTSTASLRRAEAPYWPAGHVRFGVIPKTGHSLQESTTEPVTAAVMLAWARTVARP